MPWLLLPELAPAVPPIVTLPLPPAEINAPLCTNTPWLLAPLLPPRPWSRTLPVPVETVAPTRAMPEKLPEAAVAC